MPVKVQFTRDGRPSGEAAESPFGSNDVHFEFDHGETTPRFRYTKDGNTVGEEAHGGPSVTDIGVEFHTDENGNTTFRDTHWTVRGKPTVYFPPPDGANDWHFEVRGPSGEIKKAYWTRNGRPLPREYGEHPIDVPVNVNDVHVTAIPGTAGKTISRDLEIRNLALSAVFGYRFGIGSPSLDRIVEFPTHEPIAAVSNEHRRHQLYADLAALSDRHSAFDDLSQQIGQILLRHDVTGIKAQAERLRTMEGPNPPDDLADEIFQLEEKLVTIDRRDKWEPKFPWAFELKPADLIDILVEIALILGKLAERSAKPPK
jgi:hypothetical protein